MMGPRQEAQPALFYEFSPEEHCIKPSFDTASPKNM